MQVRLSALFSRTTRSAGLATFVVLAALIGACSSRAVEPTSARAFTFGGNTRGPGPMKDPVPSRWDAELRNVGLQPGELPPIEALDSSQVMTVMRSFSESLGIPCSGCHDVDAFHADTKRKRVAKRMWNEIVRSVGFEDSGAGTVYCDSCHQGRLFPLDRRDKDKVAAFMNDGYVGKLKRTDGKDHECGTCHGDPPDFQFIAAWKNEPAPDVSLAIHIAEARALPAAQPKPAMVAASAPTAPKAKPAAPKPKPAAGSGVSCGDKNNPCPLQKWMRTNVAPAVTANDGAQLAKALSKAAELSPDPSWKWKEISLAAAEAAKRGDVTEARKSCRGCHDLYKNDYKTKFRGRLVP